MNNGTTPTLAQICARHARRQEELARQFDSDHAAEQTSGRVREATELLVGRVEIHVEFVRPIRKREETA